jgi:hypothetical protein
MLIRRPVATVFFEHNIQLNLVADRFPKGPEESYPDE